MADEAVIERDNIETVPKADEKAALESGTDEVGDSQDQTTAGDGLLVTSENNGSPSAAAQANPVDGEEANETAAGDGEEQVAVKADPNEEPEEPEPEENLPIPENDEKPESETGPTVQVTEPLSREGSPMPQDDLTATQSKEGPDALSTPPPGTQSPELSEEPKYIETETMIFDEDEEYDEESEPEEPIYNRQELIEKYHQAMEDRSSLQSLNAQLQHKLAEYFRKKKSDERQQEIEKNVTDQEQRYLKYMSNLEELQNEERRERESFKQQIEELKDRCQEKQEAVDNFSEEFVKYKQEIAKQAINSRSGRAIPPKDIDQYQVAEMKKEQEVTQVRLENIKLKNRLKKREMQLKAKEELAEGLHLIDFEQLKIENQTYNEKIEERNEELLKLRKKITTTVQVLTHLKEKLQYVQAENADGRMQLKQVEAVAAQKRDILTRTKQVRDALRIENVKLRQKCGLLGNEPLLRDYEVRKDQSDDLQSKIENLKMTHAELTMNCAGVRRKIEEARQQQGP